MDRRFDRSRRIGQRANAVGHAHALQRWRVSHDQRKELRDDVKKATGGKLEIVVHSNGSLIKHPDMLRAVSTGQVNVVEFLLGQFGNEDPVFAADNIPFVATGYDNAYRYYQAQKPLLRRSSRPRHAAALCGRVARPGAVHEEPAQVGRRSQRHQAPDVQPADRAPRGASRCESYRIQVPEMPQASPRAPCTR